MRRMRTRRGKRRVRRREKGERSQMPAWTPLLSARQPACLPLFWTGGKGRGPPRPCSTLPFICPEPTRTLRNFLEKARAAVLSPPRQTRGLGSAQRPAKLRSGRADLKIC
eukprot:8355703-Pyramimonas_sp.AAC.1